MNRLVTKQGMHNLAPVDIFKTYWDGSVPEDSYDYVRVSNNKLSYFSPLLYGKIDPYLAAGYKLSDITLNLGVPWDISRVSAPLPSGSCSQISQNPLLLRVVKTLKIKSIRRPTSSSGNQSSSNLRLILSLNMVAMPTNSTLLFLEKQIL